MKHANIKALIEAQNSHNNKLYHPVRTDPDKPDALILTFWNGAKITSYPDESWELFLRARNLSVPAVEAINLITPPEFKIKKHAARKFSVNGKDFIGAHAHIKFAPDNTYTYIDGMICMADLTEQKKELHKLTRRVRKKVQPQLRLLGPTPFQKKDTDRNLYWTNSQEEEVKHLMNILDGKDIVESLDRLRVMCNMDYLFGNGHRWGRETSSDFQPKAIIDKILRRVGTQKIAIMEKYDERKRANN